MFERGHLYWARTFTDQRRPVLLVSPAARNLLASDLIVVPLSTHLRPGPWHVRLRRGEAGAPSPSVVKCEQITTLPKERLDPRPLGGRLSSLRMAEIERAILRAIGVPIE